MFNYGFKKETTAGNMQEIKGMYEGKLGSKLYTKKRQINITSFENTFPFTFSLILGA